jgi:hypothetical protein
MANPFRVEGKANPFGGPEGSISEADARAKAGIARAQQIMASGGPQADPSTGQPAGVPAFSPAKYGMGDSASMGAADAMTFGFGDELGSYLGSAVSGDPREQVLQEMRANAGNAQSQNPGSYVAGQIGGGVAQGLATGGAGFGASAANAGGTLGKVALGSALDGLLYGGAYGAGSADGDNTDRLTGAGIGAATGMAAGAAMPYVASAVGSGIKRMVTPFAGSPEREAAVKLLAQEGVPVTAGQRTGSNVLRYAESELGGSKAADMMTQQGEAFTNAAMQKAGGSGRATSDNMSRLKDQLGQQFQALSANNKLKVDRGVLNDINAANVEYARVLPAEQKKIFGNLGGDIVQKFKDGNGVMSGEVYQTTRSRLSRMANNYKTSDPEFSQAISGLRDALDNGMDRSIRPEDASKWALARKRYGNLKTLEKAAVGGGEDSAMGIISPAQLRQAAAAGNRGGYARGQGDFAELAKAGQAVMSKLPNSGTASRAAIRNLGIPSASAGVGGLVAGIPGALAGAALPKLAGMTLMSKTGQKFLGNQVAAGGLNPVSSALLAALLRGGSTPALTDASKKALGFR